MDDSEVLARHVQNFSEGGELEYHWGYAVRQVPCNVDVGSCSYLDVVYGSHDNGMIYTGVFWAIIVGTLILWAIGHHATQSQQASVQLPVGPGEKNREVTSAFPRLKMAASAYSRRYLLPDAARPIFGRVTRTQVLVLLILSAYLIVFTFVGIVYDKWITPVKKYPGSYNTRTSLGPWSDRIGVWAYALTPLSVLLSSRESILSLATGLPYQSFNFLHRWLGYIIFVQSALHTIGWCIIEIRLYQPQPVVALQLVTETYMIWGIVAMALLLVLVLLSTPWGIRFTGYEFFRKAHYVLAMVYIGACWAHWEALNAFLLPGLLVWFLDRGVRLVRTGLLHYNYLRSGHLGFSAAQATIVFFRDNLYGDVVRLDFDHPHDAWEVGQHFYLTFPESSVWQSHPFTPLSLPVYGAVAQRHSYIFRAKKGETRKIAALSADRAERAGDEIRERRMSKTRLSVVICGPYGERTIRNVPVTSNLLCIAGGTGITYVLPILLDAAARPQQPDHRISLIWAVRHRSDIDWVSAELDVLKRKCPNLRTRIHIYVTRGSEDSNITQLTESEKATRTDCIPDIEPISASESSGSVSSALSVHGVSKAELEVDHVQARPHLDSLVQDFVADTVCGRTDVFASGPGGVISDLREAVAKCNKGNKVWKGEERWDVHLTCDDRLEW